MEMATDTISSSTAFQVRFPSLFQSGRGMAFPCDATGSVDINQLSERGRVNYFFARAMIGREFGCPVVDRAR
jgi:hypothetical protein